MVDFLYILKGLAKHFFSFQEVSHHVCPSFHSIINGALSIDSNPAFPELGDFRLPHFDFFDESFIGFLEFLNL